MKLSVGIVNYNSGQLLAQCLESLQRLNGRLKDAPVAIYDNSSSDIFFDQLQDRFSEFVFVKVNRNIGFAAAANRVIRSTDSKYILLLNPDTVIFPDTIDSMLEFMEKNPACGVLGGDIISPTGYAQTTCRLFPNYYNILFGRRSIMRKLFPKNPFSRAYLYLDMDRTRPQRVDFVEGSLMMLRRQALEEIGAFDERFFLYLEDADLCYRMNSRRWQTWWLPRSYAIHYRGENYRRDNIRPAIHHSRGFYYFFEKHYKPSKPQKIVLKFLLAVRLAYVIALESLKQVFHDINFSPDK